MTRGSLSPEVYWRRRLVVFTGVMLLLLVLVHVTGGGGSSSDGKARPVSALPRITTGKGAGHSGKPGKTGKSGKKGSGTKHQAEPGPVEAPTQPVLATPSGTCSDSDVVVTPQVADAVVGQPVPITLVLRTRTAPACTWTASANHLALKITRFTNEIWSSRLCPQQLPSTDVVVRQAVATTVQVSWTAKRAEAGCPHVSDWALPGTYRIAAAALGGPPAESTFALAPRTVVVTPPPSGTTSGKHPGKKSGKDPKRR